MRAAEAAAVQAQVTVRLVVALGDQLRATGSGAGGGNAAAFYHRDAVGDTTTDPNATGQQNPGADPISSPAQSPKPLPLSSAQDPPAPQPARPALRNWRNPARGNISRHCAAAEPTEDEILGILSALTSMGQVSAGGGTGMAAAGAFHEQMSQLPGRAQDTLKAALAEIAAHAPDAKPDQSTLVQLAEHLAIRFALDRYEKGDVKVNAVRQMLDRMNSKIDTLRKLLGSHEDKMSDAGIIVETHREILDRQFWAAVPESGKRTVLLSSEAWCIPPRNVKSYVGELVEQGNVADAVSVLQNYAACADSEDNDARKKTAAGLSEMAELYAKLDPRLLGAALQHLGVRLNVEQDAELQGNRHRRVRPPQPASRQQPLLRSDGAGARSALRCRSPASRHRATLRAKMGIEERVPEFVEEALRARQAAAGLTAVLKMLPQTTMEQLAARFNRCALRNDAENVANLAADLGEEGVQYLRSTLRGGPVTEAVEIVGLLCKLDARSAEVFLPARMKEFPRNSQDRVLRQISASGSPGRCRILLQVLDLPRPACHAARHRRTRCHRRSRRSRPPSHHRRRRSSRRRWHLSPRQSRRSARPHQRARSHHRAQAHRRG